MSLREGMVAAGTRAIWDEWEALPDYEALNADARANAHADIEIVLDAMLAYLSTNTEAWAEAGRSFDNVAATNHVTDKGFAWRLIAVLQDDQP